MATIITISGATRFYINGTGDLVEAHNASVTNINNELITKLPLAGGTMTGDINVDSHKITNLPAPVANADAARKQDTVPAAGSIVESMLASAAVTAAKIGTDAVETAKIKNANVTTEKLEYKEYVATVSQAGTSTPVASVIRNTLGGTPTWAYGSTGIYTCTLTGAFTAGKTAVLIGPGAVQVDKARFCYDFGTIDTITFLAFGAADAPANSVMTDTTIIIRVYP